MKTNLLIREGSAIVEIGIDLLNEESRIESLEKEISLAECKAGKLGAKAGLNAAEWVAQDSWGGRVTRGEKGVALAFLDALDNGGELPEPPNLSGEWADSETSTSLMERLLGEDWQDTPEFVEAQDELCQAWQDSCTESFLSGLRESAESFLS